MEHADPLLTGLLLIAAIAMVVCLLTAAGINAFHNPRARNAFAQHRMGKQASGEGQ